MEYISRIAGFSCLPIDEKVFFFAYARDYFCVYDVTQNKQELIPINCNNYMECNKQLYHLVLANNDWILFVPRVAEDIILYNVKMHDLKYIKIPTPRCVSDFRFKPDEAKFCSGFSHGEFFYLLGVSYPGIVRINCNTLETIVIDDWIDNFERMVEKDYWGYISIGHYVSEGKAILPLACVPGFLFLDLTTNATDLQQVNIPYKDGMYGLSGDDNSGLWLTGVGENSNIICNIANGAKKELYVESENGDSHVFYPPILTSYGVFLVPIQHERIIYRLDSDSNCFRVWKEYDESEAVHLSGYSFMEPFVSGDKLILIDGWSFDWHVLDLKNNTEESFCINVSDNPIENMFWKRMLRENARQGNINYEGALSLKVLLNSLKARDI
jgi:hypothetical protein